MTASSTDNAAGWPEVVWPTRVIRPPRPPALVYLDLNHFIYLARAAANDSSIPPGYDRLLISCRAACVDGRAVFPLSATHYVEMSGIIDPAKRGPVADVMEELSRFAVMLGRVTLTELEVEAMIDRQLGQRTDGETFPLLGENALWAFGRRGGLNVVDEAGNDVTANVRSAVGAETWDEQFAEITRAAERALLAGPPDEALPALRAAGYQPEFLRVVTERRAKQERDQVARLDAAPQWRRGRLRDVVGGRELTLELIDVLTRRLVDRGVTIGDVVQDRDTIRAFAEGMPSTRVAITLKTQYHRNGQHHWTTNDIHDIDALAVAVAYCDAVFTDKAARSALVVAPELSALHTYLPRRATELADWLDQLPTA